MNFELIFNDVSNEQMNYLQNSHDHQAIYHAVGKILGYMATDLHHPSLHTHKYDAITGANGEEVFEAYAKNRTPEAYRIFWHYGPGEHQLTILEIVPHP
jgi:hypothetical protein